jgi:hypothetical protein
MGKGWGRAVEEGYIDLRTMHVQVTKAKIPLNNDRHLNNNGQEWKTGHTKGRALTEGGG